ncbi:MULTISPECIES: YhdP family protein [Dyella]|uniref:TIGR02099 family protein n=2 Tax=Dyella TaxID=231454 RepID=A0A4R0Z388_9GAMM|nr:MULTISPECIES: YhdP family protein [Dyella]TBR38713.1 TIGR02099 family protein [Dyella terrae]TCI13696.1 TIGR02099 family protein [Dyella soli]
MNAIWRQRAHRVARLLGWVAGVAVITLAVLAGLIQLLLPSLARHPEWVARQLSQQLHQPVTFASLEGRWQPSGPLLVMRDVTVSPVDGGAPLRIPETELKLDLGGWLMPSRHLLNLRARGLQLDLSRAADGVWHVNGIGVAGGEDRQAPSFGRLSAELWLYDLRVEIADERVGKHYTLNAKQLRMSRQGGRVRVGAILERAGAPGQIRGAGSFSEDGSDGRVWLAGDQIDLRALTAGVDMAGYTIERGQGNVASWLDWRHGRVVRNLTRFDLNNLSLVGPDGHRAMVPGLHGLSEIRKGDDVFGIKWLADDGSALAVDARHLGSDDASVAVAARDLQLAPLVPWLALKPDMSPSLAEWLGAGKPRGKISHASMQWSKAGGLTSVDMGFAALGIDPVGKLPGLDRLDGEVRGDQQAAVLELPAQSTVLRFPHTFRQPFNLSRLAGNVAFWHADGDLHMGLDALQLHGEGFEVEARGEMALHDGGGKPFLDLYATVNHADVNAAKLFWPIDSMAPSAIEWLDRALVSGNIDRGDVVVRGDLADWPFHHNEGRFEARAQISDLTLDYGKDWPRAEGVNLVANFIDNSMLVEASGGQSLGIKADKASATIADFGNSELDLTVSGAGNGPNVMEFLRKSPIASHQADILSKMSLGGSTSFGFHLLLPLKEAKDFTLTGTAQLKDADLNAPDWNLKLDKIRGPATFDQHGFHGGPLDAGFRGQPSRLDIAIAGATGNPDTVLSTRLTGKYAMNELVQGYPELDWLKPIAGGRSEFTIGFDIVHPPSVANASQLLTIESPMTGMSLDFPVPLKKSADETLPLRVAMNLPVAGSDLQVSIGQVVRGRLRLPEGNSHPLAATFAFGNRMPDTVPDKGIRVRGKPAVLDVTGWVQYSVAGATGDGPGLESIDVNADQAMVFGHSFPSMRIQATPGSDALSVDVDSSEIAGNFSVPSNDLRKRGVTARLDRLYWPRDNTPEKPKSEGAPLPDPANTGVTPSSLPPFHVWVADLRFGVSKLGEARLETWPTDRGMHVDQLRALSHSVQINGSGDWEGTDTNSHTHMRIDFAAENLGDMLGAFGFSGLFNGGKTRANLDATWPGAPSAMELASMNGKLGIQVTDGSIPEVAPGVGRLFGLISVIELPRRLTLDFGDVFGKGLAFDAITGDFELNDGDASTKNLQIRGPAADISVTGRTGLRAKDYDQQVLVVPHVGNSLPIVGGVVGGPIGAAAGFVAQGILGRGLNHAASARYRITGTWDKPVYTLIEKRSAGPAKAGAVPTPPATPAAPAPASSAGR